jgi:hypothetical protein
MEVNEARLSGDYDQAVPRIGSAAYQRQRRARLRVQRRQVCRECNHDFTPSRSDAKFCSDGCRFRAHRQRLKARAEAERERALAKAAALQKAADLARRRSDFVASLIA